MVILILLAFDTRTWADEAARYGAAAARMRPRWSWSGHRGRRGRRCLGCFGLDGCDGDADSVRGAGELLVEQSGVINVGIEVRCWPGRFSRWLRPT